MLLGRAHVAARVALHLVGHRRGEQQRLVLLRQVRRDALDVLEEAHRQHLVALVEHERRDRAAVERAPADVIEHAARRADDDVHAVAQRVDLLADRRAAVDGLDQDAAVLADLRQLARDLQRELARRARGSAPAAARCAGTIRLTIGRPNAVVLPVPVRDWTSRSLPSVTGLNTAVCTGVGAK